MFDKEEPPNAERDGNTELEIRRKEFRSHCLNWKGKIGRIHINCNPLTSIVSAVIIWTVIAFALTYKDTTKEYFVKGQEWITETWTWLYVLAQCVWTVLVIIIYFKFGHLKLGKDDDEPEFNDFSYYCMVFTTGLGSGIFYSGVKDPILYYMQADDGINYWGKSNLNNRAQNAINITIFHWGLHGYSVYIIPTLLIGILTHRKGLPLTMRTCFYPLFGRKIFGRFGDIVDILSIITIIFGVSISLSLGAILLNSGIHIINDGLEKNRDNHIICIWILTTITTISVISGIKLGIRRLSQVCFVTASFLLIFVLLSDDTGFILNVFVQSIGFYLQHFIGTGLYTGAFAQTGNSPKQEGSPNWMHNNTIFWWGWWVAWAPLTSMFIVRVSKGRTIRNVIFYNFFLTAIWISFWMSTFAGIGLNMQNKAMKANITCDMYNKHGERIPNQTLWAADEFVERLDCKPGESMLFEVLYKYEDMAAALQILATISIVFFFSTSSDSASLVVDIIASNGEEKPPVAQRIFWALTEGSAATALAFYGSMTEDRPKDAAIEACAAVIGLPFNIIICVCCLSLWRVLKREPKWEIDLDGRWYMVYGNINSRRLLKKVTVATFCPWFYMGDIIVNEGRLRRWRYKIFAYLQFAVPFFVGIIFLFVQLKVKYIEKAGVTTFLVLIVYSANIRKKLRHKSNQIIEGNIVEDIVSMILYPFTIVQMHEEMIYHKEIENNNHIELQDESVTIGNTYIEPGIDNGSFVV